MSDIANLFGTPSPEELPDMVLADADYAELVALIPQEDLKDFAYHLAFGDSGKARLLLDYLQHYLFDTNKDTHG